MLRRRPAVGKLLDDKCLRELHRGMFGNVWSWAGKYRTLGTNMGIEPPEIATAVAAALVEAVEAKVIDPQSHLAERITTDVNRF